jgi:hypothetical protein
MIAGLLLLAQIAAFPGAMGGGTLTIGGRGGTIMEITNLNDSGTGSFRACVTGSGPRTCVCRVSGAVPVNSDITVGSPFITFDGQMCPGGGLIIGNGAIQGRELNIVTHDAVFRYLTFNVNNPNTPVGPDLGTVGIEIGTGAYNVVLDHLSVLYPGNKPIISYTSTTTQAAVIHDVTQQWNLIALPNVGHPVGCMTDTAAYAYLNINQDFHHNFYSQFGHRECLYNTNQGHFVNNLTYNWSDPSACYGFAMEPQGPSQVDMIGNIWVPGNMNACNTANPHPVNINATGSSDCTVSCWNGATQPSHYMLGNVCAQGTDWQCAAQVTSEGGPETGVVPAAWQRKAPLPAEPNPILADPVTGLDTKILATVGNSQGLNCDGSWNTLHRNAIDQMVISAYPKGTGALFNQQYPAPTAAAGTPCPEDPVTHVPTAYLALRGIPAGTSPWTVWKGDVYPILETYGNGNGSTPVTPPVVTCAPSSVAPGGNSSCSANQAISTWNTTSGTITPTGSLTAPMTPSTVTVTGTNSNGSGQTPVVVATPGTYTGWLGTDALTGTLAIGNAVVINSNAGPVRASACTTAGGAVGPPISPQPTNIVGTTVTVVGGPSPACSSGVVFWQVQSSGTPPPPHPTVSCSPTSVQVGATSQCTANQAVTWSASIGTISASGLFTAPAQAGTAQITGTNANGAGTTPITVTAAPPQQFNLSCTVNGSAIACTGTMP